MSVRNWPGKQEEIRCRYEMTRKHEIRNMKSLIVTVMLILCFRSNVFNEFYAENK